MIKIYKLIHNDNVVYIGQTKTDLKKRKRWGYKNNKLLQQIYKECSIELLEETNDKSRERFWIEKYENDGIELLNIQKGCGYNKKEYKKMTNNIHEKNWCQNNPDRVKEIKAKYRENNRETLREKGREYSRKRRLEIKNKLNS